ncbi:MULTISPECIES: hypothetical protein [unclassified Rhizobium]|jgi:hypothetical protein|uniref:hypothetical protein n=1 Tax=unclassified Rhizobium TaxID=2613769 RepID=UPI000645DE40|nr:MULTISPECIES: hypothetical protein [unclassified Rhizobium]MBN8951814.1 hypothetical protein [Rhizobium tropici]OJY73944.1 MAG: hypothetical protein BGP09_26370 [Rhizobium sp. 60-20]RKD61763.1 hypothetical protein BJ928_107365 [Rhizobium sp. WW_1]
MTPHLLKAAALVLAAAATLSFTPASAGDYRHWHHHDRSGIVRLHQIYQPQAGGRQQPTRILMMERRDAASAGSYAGSADVYRADGGTYVIGYGGYNPYARSVAAQPRPKAKVIDVRYAGNPCSYEAGVCIIRH